MGSKAYNGWSGEIRDLRGNLFYSLVKKGEIAPPEKCYVCGAINCDTTSRNTYHAEEYGSTWSEYLEACRPVCPYCHGMIHLRFRLPNRFKRMKVRAREGTLLAQAPKFANLFTFFGSVRKVGDMAYVEDSDSGLGWLDKMALKAYSGPPKIATILHVEHGEVPDPKVYPSIGVEGLSGVVVREVGSIEHVKWNWVSN